MGSIHPPRKEDYAKNTRIDVNQSYQLAYWMPFFRVTYLTPLRGQRTSSIPEW